MKNLVIYPLNKEGQYDGLIQWMKESQLDEVAVLFLVELDMNASQEVIREKIAVSLSDREEVQILEIKDEHELSIQERLAKVETALLNVMKKNDYHLYLILNQCQSSFLQMVMHYCVSTFYHQLTVISDPMGKQGSEVESIKIEPYLSEEGLSHHFYELVISNNFKAAKSLISNRELPHELERLLDFGQELLSLQVRKGKNGMDDPFTLLISQLEKYGERAEVHYVENLKKIQAGDQKAFIHYLYNYAEIVYEANDLIDFIVLFYRLAEETLLYSLGWDTRPYSVPNRNSVFVRKDQPFFLQVPNERMTNHLHSYMKVLRREVRRIEDRYRVTIRRDKCVGLERLPARDRYFADLYLFFKDKGLEDILELRHEGVSGHGFADFNKEEFEAFCGGQSPLEKMDSLLAQLQLKPQFSLFKLIQKGILGLVQENDQLLVQEMS
ncbi:hypothetical protein [Niallia endozanthoxylica]|uniref:Uncharacterized protein n=1 Tax=Niallia endozanthoxylica TaxID=2036016 RepID=A0A5J5I2W6_9BACI|nr:hypothetical protein [Niallia endozanthoxylica]KAA9030642.1 hypothetical protein F4V44_02285 [Niallia endozanthoxylica]